MNLNPRFYWLPVGHVLRTAEIPIISIDYKIDAGKKSVSGKKKPAGPRKHIIHKAILWRKMFDEGEVESLSQISRKENLTRARVTQIMNLLKLPAEIQEFLVGLDDPREIRKYSERKIRKVQPDSLAKIGANPSQLD